MTHINFNIKDWKLENPEGTLTDLVQSIESAEEVYSGWVVQDAEAIRQASYADRTDLSIADSQVVVSNINTHWNAQYGFSWYQLSKAYNTHVYQLDEDKKPPTAKQKEIRRY